MSKAPPAYPAVCPDCHEAAGWPYSAGTCQGVRTIIVNLRCRSCGREWSADAPKPEMASAGLLPGRHARRYIRRTA